jgi:hypothetical protein
MFADFETVSRAVAGLVAAVVIAWPYIPAAVGYLTAGVGRRTEPAAATRDDAITVVGIARRLQARGHKAGVGLCQQLIDVLISIGSEGD